VPLGWCQPNYVVGLTDAHLLFVNLDAGTRITPRTEGNGLRHGCSPPCAVVGLRSRSDVHALLVQRFEDGALADRATARASGDEPRQRLLHGAEAPDLLLDVRELRFGPSPHIAAGTTRIDAQAQ